MPWLSVSQLPLGVATLTSGTPRCVAASTTWSAMHWARPGTSWASNWVCSVPALIGGAVPDAVSLIWPLPPSTAFTRAPDTP